MSGVAVQFATSDPATARARIAAVVPRVPDALAAAVLAGVELGHLTVGDPLMYGGRAPVWPTAACTPETQDALATAAGAGETGDPR